MWCPGRGAAAIRDSLPRRVPKRSCTRTPTLHSRDRGHNGRTSHAGTDVLCGTGELSYRITEKCFAHLRVFAQYLEQGGNRLALGNSQLYTTTTASIDEDGWEIGVADISTRDRRSNGVSYLRLESSIPKATSDLREPSSRVRHAPPAGITTCARGLPRLGDPLRSIQPTRPWPRSPQPKPRAQPAAREAY